MAGVWVNQEAARGGGRRVPYAATLDLAASHSV